MAMSFYPINILHMKLKAILAIMFTTLCVLTEAQTGIGTNNPDSSAKLDITSTSWKTQLN